MRERYPQEDINAKVKSFLSRLAPDSSRPELTEEEKLIEAKKIATQDIEGLLKQGTIESIKKCVEDAYDQSVAKHDQNESYRSLNILWDDARRLERALVVLFLADKAD